MTDAYDDDAGARREAATHRRAQRLAAEARRRTRQRRVAAVGAVVLLVALIVVVGTLVASAGSRGGVAGQPAAAAAATISVEPTVSLDASETTTTSSPTTKAPDPASAQTGTPFAIADYAATYPDAPAVTPVVIRRLTPKRKLVAITLDDGVPFDTRMLELFEKNGVRCTTFVLGQFASTHTTLMKRLKADGFEIANHTWDHKTLTHLSESSIRKELSRTQAAISKVTGDQAPYMRPPGGAYNSTVKRVAGSMGYRVVMWSRSLADTSSSATPRQCYKNAVNNLKPGEIILCHWGRPATYEAMKLILPELRARGFEVVTVSELIADSGGIAALK